MASVQVLARSEWPPMPETHTAFLERALETLPSDPRIVGLALGGSFVTGTIDAYSDLDFVVAVDPGSWPAILDARREIAGGLGPLLEAFTGEHVGEPRLLICLYGPPLLHVDLKFVSLDDVHERVEDPVVVYERDGALSAAYRRSEAAYPQPDLDWIEARFWIWAHYGATKIARGELFETLNFLGFLRFRVLGPMALAAAGTRPDGVRRIETRIPETAERLAASVGSLDADACMSALDATIELYVDLRARLGGGGEPSAVEREARRYVDEIRSSRP
jgi:hypothetical protein